MSDSGSIEPKATESVSQLPIEVGLVTIGRIDPVDEEAVELARRRIEGHLLEWFAEFTWRLTVVERREATTNRRDEPVVLLEQAQTERDLHKWDFVLVITSSDLIGHDKPFALAAVSRTLDSAVLSTARIDPRAVDASADRESRIMRLAHRIEVMIVRCLGHLNGLDHDLSPDNYMWDADDVAALDDIAVLTSEQILKMRENLKQIADLRLEERGDPSLRSSALFVLRAAWFGRWEILAGLMEAAPWLFPVRFSRLTTAAVSALLILLMTAEVWDMSMNQSAASVAGLMLMIIVITTAYIVIRQRLFEPR